MKKIILGFLVLSLVAISGWAQQDPVLRNDYPSEYTVVKGDTLWDISNRFLQTPWMWPEIWHVNPQIANPHLIYPGDVITLIYLDGRPRITVQRGAPSGTVKLSPNMRVTPLSEAIPTIPLDAINTYLSNSRIVDSGELEAAPHVVASGENRLIAGKGDTVYVRGSFDPDIPVYGVYRKGEVFVDPDTGERLGVQATDIAAVKIRDVENQIATTETTRANQEIRVGDRLLIEEVRKIDTNFFPSPPNDDIEGTILAVEGGVNNVGNMDVVVINRGEREGVKVGNVFAIYHSGQVIRDRVLNDNVVLPEERAGLLMVFRTFEKLSYALVLEADMPIARMNTIKRP
ncbi:LysM peptidoglycan-binding domain-containing protein [Aurantivibrio infirmus]